MRFKTLIAAILALGIGLHALPAPARGGAPVSRSTAAMPNVDINTATPAQLKALPGLNDSESAKIVQSRPYSDKSQLVSKKVLKVAEIKEGPPLSLDLGAVASHVKEVQKRTGK